MPKTSKEVQIKDFKKMYYGNLGNFLNKKRSKEERSGGTVD